MCKTTYFQNIIYTMIVFYQKHISPYKGFCCAHKALYKGMSCSEWAKHAIKKVGIYRFLLLLRRRLKACKAAYYTLSDNKKNNHDKSDKGGLKDEDCVGCCIASFPCYWSK